MREILFRGKRTDNHQWVKGFLIIEGRLENPNPYIVIERRKHRVAHKTVEQYTGLTDKNGVKIFEGDILMGQYDEDSPEDIAILVVLWDNNWHIQQGDRVPDLLEEFDCQICEVIGNIHDNPELLKGGELNETPH